MPIALKFLCAALFILAAVPRLNISLGPVPIYGIDVCLLGAIYYGGLQRNPLFGKVPFASLVLAILGFALFSEFVSGAFLGTYIETVYMSVRMCLAVALFFLLNNIVTDEDDVQHILQACTAGLLVTTFLMAMTSMPGTRGLVAWIFKYDFLTPVGEGFFAASKGLERGTRGQSLVGYNIISAWFVCLLWPLAITLYRSPKTLGRWKLIAMVACFAAPFGVLFAYSRGALLGMLLVISGLLFFGEGRLKGQIAVAIIVVTGIIGFVGWDSDIFYFERIERRTRATFENPLENEMESERISSYVDPFIVVSENPAMLIGGQGITAKRVAVRGHSVSGESPFAVDLGRNIADHSVFSKATLTYGMAAAGCYLLLWFNALRSGYYEARFGMTSSGLSRYFPQLTFAAVVGLTAWVAFDKGIIIQPRGAMMFFFITGLIGVCQNLRISNEIDEGEEDEGLETSDEGSESHAVEALYR